MNTATSEHNKKAFLVIGNYGNDNIGDETILKGLVLDLIGQHGRQIKVLVLTRSPSFVATYHPEFADVLSAVPVSGIAAILRSSLNAHEIVVGGGGIWSYYTGPFAKLILIYTLALRCAFKRISIRRVGIYRTASAWQKFLFNLNCIVLSNVSVRDPESRGIVWPWLRRKVKLKQDYAFDYLQQLDEVRPAKTSRDPLLTGIKEQVNSPNVSLLTSKSCAEIYHSIQRTDFFIGMRYHSMLFSIIAERPLLAIPYENKCRNLTRTYARCVVLEPEAGVADDLAFKGNLLLAYGAAD